MGASLKSASVKLCCVPSAFGTIPAKPRRRVFIARHGEKVPNTIDRDNFELPLLASGEEALREVRAFLDAHDVVFSAILCSPYKRCRETAAILSSCERFSIEPGLCEVLSPHHGLRDGKGGTSLANLVTRVQESLDASSTPVPLVAASELEEDDSLTFEASMRRARTFASRLEKDLKNRPRDAPVLLVGHGGSVFGVVEALQSRAVPTWDKDRMPEMGSITELEEIDGRWRVLGHIVPCRNAKDAWICCWSRGAATGADYAKL